MMISTTKVLCFVAIAFADSDFQTDHDAGMRELSEGENQGLDTIEEQRELAEAIEEFRELVGDIEEFRELVGDTDEFRELADAIADEDREVFWKKWKKRKAAKARAEKVEKCKNVCGNKWKYRCRNSTHCKKGMHNRGGCIRKCTANWQKGLAHCKSTCDKRHLDEDEEVSAAVLV